MISNDDDTRVVKQQFFKKLPWHYLISNDDDTNLAPQQTKEIALAPYFFKWWWYQGSGTAILKK